MFNTTVIRLGSGSLVVTIEQLYPPPLKTIILSGVCQEAASPFQKYYARTTQ